LLCRDSQFAWFWLNPKGPDLVLGDGAGNMQAALTFSGWSLRVDDNKLRYWRGKAGEWATYSFDAGTGRALLVPGNVQDRAWLVRPGKARELDLKITEQPLLRTVTLPTTAMPIAFVEDHIGRRWVGTSSGLLVADPKRTIRLVADNDEPAAEKPSARAKGVLSKDVSGESGSDGDGPSSDRHVVLARIDRVPASTRVMRLVTSIGLPVVATGVLAWRFVRRHRRNACVRNKPMPYVAGPAVSDPNQFGVRRALLNRLCNYAAGSNRALVGEWRIGKTSLQLQLTRLLESADDPAYVFFPLFVDLHKLGDDAQARFFKMLGRALFRKARERGVPDSILDDLDYCDASGDQDSTGGARGDGQAGENPPDDYSLLSLENDLHALRKHWERA